MKILQFVPRVLMSDSVDYSGAKTPTASLSYPPSSGTMFKRKNLRDSVIRSASSFYLLE